MGDAAHAATAHQAAGVGQVLEDALILSHLLGAISSPADIERAFHAYDSVRRERTQRVVSTSREAARVYQFEDEIIGDDLDKIAGNLTGRYDWIWEVDLDEELRKAKVAYASLSPDH
jgi:salicylate hydroxylase